MIGNATDETNFPQIFNLLKGTTEKLKAKNEVLLGPLIQINLPLIKKCDNTTT